jgi:two-component system chemotaxis response regulator CheB
MRAMLTEVINSAADMEVVGVAPDPLVAREMIKQKNPDVITLDVEMPKMDGLEFLERLMRLRPTPVVMISTLTERGSNAALRALELGAVDVVSKPRVDLGNGLGEYAHEVCDKIRVAHGTRHRMSALAASNQTARQGPTIAKPLFIDTRSSSDRLIAIGASTGGTEAIKTVLSAMPETAPGIVIVQHMPESFTPSFAKRLDGLCRVRVKEAENGERILPGHAYLAPGHSHLLVRRRGTDYVCELSSGAPVNRHRPSVDVLFDSLAEHAGSRAVAALLTGMGKDGAKGMLAMYKAGSYTIAQNEATCVVYGMPREAVAMGGVHESVALDEIAARLVASLSHRERERAAARA